MAPRPTPQEVAADLRAWAPMVGKLKRAPAVSFQSLASTLQRGAATIEGLAREADEAQHRIAELEAMLHIERGS